MEANGVELSPYESLHHLVWQDKKDEREPSPMYTSLPVIDALYSEAEGKRARRWV